MEAIIAAKSGGWFIQLAGPVSRFNNEKVSLPRISIFSPLSSLEESSRTSKADWLNGWKVRGGQNFMKETILGEEKNELEIQIKGSYCTPKKLLELK